MKGKLIFLGTGASLGVPMLGCTCAVCTSNDPYNKRLRSSALLKIAGRQFLIDIGPDFRFQALRSKMTDLNGLLLTHAHYDHIAGLDDLRALLFKRSSPLPILLSKETALELQSHYHYFFKKSLEKDFYPLELSILPEKEGWIEFENMKIEYFTYIQSKVSVNGFRLGDLAYVSDIRQYDDSIFNYLKGVRHLILSALRFIPSPAHFSVDEAIDFASRTGAEHAWLTHLSHELDHRHVNAYLPSHVRLAYDGLEIDFE